MNIINDYKQEGACFVSTSNRKSEAMQKEAWERRCEIQEGDCFIWKFSRISCSDGTVRRYGTSGNLPRKYMPVSSRWREGRVVMTVCKVYEGANGYGNFVDYWLIPNAERQCWSGTAEDCIIINGPDAFKMQRKSLATRYKDCYGNRIYLGDICRVEEYPGKYVDGAYSYEGVVEECNGTVCVTYYDIGEEEALALSLFPVSGRELLTEKERYEYWRTAMLGGEPPERLWKREIYAKTTEKIIGER